MKAIAFVMIGGMGGALVRYGFGVMSLHWAGHSFPWGTLAVNWLGCGLIGLVYGLIEHHWTGGHAYKPLIITGFLGALTTFSAYGLDTALLLRQGAWWRGALNIALNNVGGMGLLFAGMAVARHIPVR